MKVIGKIIDKKLYTVKADRLTTFLQEQDYEELTLADNVINGDFVKLKNEVYIKDTQKEQEVQDEQTQAEFREKRDSLLEKADYKINFLEDNNKDSSLYKTYRQALRDSTETWQLPSEPKEV